MQAMQGKLYNASDSFYIKVKLNLRQGLGSCFGILAHLGNKK